MIVCIVMSGTKNFNLKTMLIIVMNKYIMSGRNCDYVMESENKLKY